MPPHNSSSNDLLVAGSTPLQKRMDEYAYTRVCKRAKNKERKRERGCVCVCVCVCGCTCLILRAHEFITVPSLSNPEPRLPPSSHHGCRCSWNRVRGRYQSACGQDRKPRLCRHSLVHASPPHGMFLVGHNLRGSSGERLGILKQISTVNTPSLSLSSKGKCWSALCRCRVYERVMQKNKKERERERKRKKR